MKLSNFLALVAISLSFVIYNTYASEEDVAGKGEAGTEEVASEAPPLEEFQHADLTYEAKAKILAARIAKGFQETSKVPALTACIKKGTALFSKNLRDNDSVTETYLLMGKDTGLNLDDRDAVEKFLQTKFNERVVTNVKDKATAWISSKVGTCISVVASKYYQLRLKAALDYAYKGVIDVDAIDADVEKIIGTGPVSGTEGLLNIKE